MANWKFEIFLGKSGFGPTEDYLTTDMDAATARSTLISLLGLRKAILPALWEFGGVRVGVLGQLRASTILLPGLQPFPDGAGSITIPSVGAYSGEVADSFGLPVRYDLQLRARYNTRHYANRYLSGLPRDLVDGEPATVHLERVPLWASGYIRYLAYLSRSTISPFTALFGVYARVPIPDQPAPPAPDPQRILRWSQQDVPPSNLGATILAANLGDITVGSKVHVYGTRTKVVNFAEGARAPNPNGAWYVDAISTFTGPPSGFTLFLRGTTQFSADSIKILGRLWPVTFTVYPIEAVTTQRALSRKRGKSSLVPRGRRLTRVSADP